MVREMKYVIIEKYNETPILFENFIDHVCVCQKAISAGFFTLSDEKNGEVSVSCYGNSTTLGVKSRGIEDAQIIVSMLNRGCHQDGKRFVVYK